MLDVEMQRLMNITWNPFASHIYFFYWMKNIELLKLKLDGMKYIRGT